MHALVGGEPRPGGRVEAGERRLAAPCHRLLAELEPEVARTVEIAAERGRIVAGVRIGAQGDLRTDGVPDPAQPVGVLVDVLPQLHLERAEALGDILTRRRDRLLRRLDTDRHRGRERLVDTAEEIDHGDAEVLAEKIPERHVAGGARRRRRGELALEEARQPADCVGLFADEAMRGAVERRAATLG